MNSVSYSSCGSLLYSILAKNQLYMLKVIKQTRKIICNRDIMWPQNLQYLLCTFRQGLCWPMSIYKNYAKHFDKIMVVVVVSDSCNPMDCSPPTSFVLGIFWERILQCVAISFSRELTKLVYQFDGLCALQYLRNQSCPSMKYAISEDLANLSSLN